MLSLKTTKNCLFNEKRALKFMPSIIKWKCIRILRFGSAAMARKKRIYVPFESDKFSVDVHASI